MKASTTTAGLAATTLVVAAAVTGCGGDKSPSPSSSSSSTSKSASSTSSSPAAPSSSSAAAQPGDYSNLLIKPTDIVVPGDTFTLMTSNPQPNPGGIAALFGNSIQATPRLINDNIYVYPDAGQAGQARDGFQQTLTDPDLGVKGGTPTPADVGTGGTVASGTTTKADGPKSKTVVIFTEGRAFVDLEFESGPSDPVPSDIVLDVARKQDAAIKAGLPS